MYPDRPPRNPCIVCGIREGEIPTADGSVCPICMPKALLSTSRSLRLFRLKTYIKANPGYETCVRIPDALEGTPTGQDRSMAITSADSVILADEVNARLSESDGADIVVSFIKMAGLNLIIDALRAMTERGGRLRVITTAYMGNTEVDAVLTLTRLKNTEVRMELNAERTRLHAKAMLFRSGSRRTAYVGSANISKTALTTGEEWVVKIRGEDLPMVISDLVKGFENLWGAYHLMPVDGNSRSLIEGALERKGR